MCHHCFYSDPTTSSAPPQPPHVLTPAEQADAELGWKVAAEYCATVLWTAAGQAAREYLHQRGLSDQTIRDTGLGYHPKTIGSDGLGDHLFRLDRTLYDAAQTARVLGKQGRQKHLLKDTITIPYWRDSQRTSCAVLRARQLNPQPGDPKYLSPAGIALFGSGPPSLYLGEWLAQTDKVILTEGEIKALIPWQAWRAGDLSLPAVGQPSIAFLPDAMLDQLAGKTVYLCYDAEGRRDPFTLSPGEKYTIKAGERITGATLEHEIAQKRRQLGKKGNDDLKTQAEIDALDQQLSVCKARRITLYVLRLPRDPDVAKVDLDSFLLDGTTAIQAHRCAELERLVKTAPRFDDWYRRHGATEYYYSQGHIMNGRSVANYAAVIAEDQTLDDGSEQSVIHNIQAITPTGLRRSFTIPADVWADDRKARQALRAGLGDGTADDEGGEVLRAIKQLSLLGDGPARRTVYAATGWQRIGGPWCYLMPDGAITARGVDLAHKAQIGHAPGQHYAITGDGDAQAGARSFLELLRGNVCPQPIALLLAGHAVLPLVHTFLGDTDRPLLWLYGESGSLKTSLARSVLACYGPKFTGTRGGGGPLPKWETTIVGVEQVTFTYRDALTMLDDYKQATVDPKVLGKVLHGYSEGAGRTRGTVDKSRGVKLARDYPARCILLATGEDRPAADPGQLARVLLIPMQPGTVQADALARLQHAGERGDLVAFWRGLIQQIAVELDRGDFGQHLRDLLDRDDAALPGHKRTTGALRQNRVAFLVLTAWLERASYITAEQRQQLNADHLDARRVVAEEQASTQHDDRPSQLFLQWLAERVMTGEYVLDANDPATGLRDMRQPAPIDQVVDDKPAPYFNRDRLIGFAVGDDRLAILPSKALGDFKRARQQQGDPIKYSSEMIGKQLDHDGALADKDHKAGKTQKVERWRSNGGPQRVWVVWRSTIGFDVPVTPVTPVTPSTIQGVTLDPVHQDAINPNLLHPLHPEQLHTTHDDDPDDDRLNIRPPSGARCNNDSESDLAHQEAVKVVTPSRCNTIDHPFPGVDMAYVLKAIERQDHAAIERHLDIRNRLDMLDAVIAWAESHRTVTPAVTPHAAPDATAHTTEDATADQSLTPVEKSAL